MKSYLALILALITLVACENNQPEPEPYRYQYEIDSQASLTNNQGVIIQSTRPEDVVSYDHIVVATAFPNYQIVTDHDTDYVDIVQHTRLIAEPSFTDEIVGQFSLVFFKINKNSDNAFYFTQNDLNRNFNLDNNSTTFMAGGVIQLNDTNARFVGGVSTGVHTKNVFSNKVNCVITQVADVNVEGHSYQEIELLIRDDNFQSEKHGTCKLDWTLRMLGTKHERN